MHGIYTYKRAIASQKNDPPGWRQLPHKDQVFVLGLCRLVDFLQVASFQAYIVFQIKSLHPSSSDALISWKTGIVQGSFSAAQCFTAVIWGRLADASWCGRKNVLLIGLFSTAISCIGVAFATSVTHIVLWRAFGGGMNGTVGIIRTMISENVHEKRFQSCAFLILPLSFSIASLLGPLIGGFLAEAGRKYSEINKETPENAVAMPWIVSFPYALSSLLSAGMLLAVTLVVFLCIRETLSSYDQRKNIGQLLGMRLETFIRTASGGRIPPQSLLYNDARETQLLRSSSSDSDVTIRAKLETPQLPFLRIFTSNVMFTFLAQAFFDFHLGAFTSLWPLFLSTPKKLNNSGLANDLTREKSLQELSRGLNMSTEAVGVAMAILGASGLAQQLLFYRSVHARLGSVRCYQYFTLVFPLGYIITPYLLLLPPGIALWSGIVVLSCLLATARTFTLPSSIVLLNNCTPHPSALGTVHGLGQSVSAGLRTIGPVIGGYWYSLSLSSGIAGEAWWFVALAAFFGWVATLMVREGSGHDIVLEGE